MEDLGDKFFNKNQFLLKKKYNTKFFYEKHINHINN